MMNPDISKHIFRAYDIRGLYEKDITPELFYKIGMASGNFVKKSLGGNHVTIGGDIRKSSPKFIALSQAKNWVFPF